MKWSTAIAAPSLPRWTAAGRIPNLNAKGAAIGYALAVATPTPKTRRGRRLARKARRQIRRG
ncbi:MAG TPA: hypothetical protein VMW08_00615 [Acidimicrobiales bacterium]|nr:hypothetical protein [Acidimicrobiales bacterium]